jgi:hypothetical protein
MNDKSQVDFHKDKVILLTCDVDATEGGYYAACLQCPWTSGIRDSKELAKKAYWRHIGYIMNRLGE